MKKPVIRIRQNHYGFFIVEQKPDWFSSFINYLFGSRNSGNWICLQSFGGDDAFEKAMAFAKRARNLIVVYVDD